MHNLRGDNMYDIYEKLLALRNVTTADVCKATGISQSTMSNWKKRRNDLSVKNAQKVADYFGVTVDYLMTGTERTEQPPYYLDDDARDYAQFLFDNPEYRVLFDASRSVKKEDIQFVKEMIDRMTKN